MSNDHWVSQFILKSFVDEGRVWAFDKITRKYIRRSVRKICCEEGFTTFQNDCIPPGMNGQFLEKELSKWERLQSQTITKLREERSIHAIEPSEFWELIRFAVWLHICNPANRQMLRQFWNNFHVSKVKSLTKNEIDEISLKFFGLLLPHSHLRERLELAASQENLLQSEFLGMALKSADSSFNLVKTEYAWSLDDFHNFDSILCTSDRPVIIGGKNLEEPVGFGTTGAMLFFPLSPNLCLSGCNVGYKKRFIKSCNLVKNADFTQLPKLLMWSKSQQFIIAAKQSALPPRGIELPTYTPSVVKVGSRMGIIQR